MADRFGRADRKVAYEWTQLEPFAATMDLTPAFIRGRRDHDDVSYQYLPAVFGGARPFSDT